MQRPGEHEIIYDWNQLDKVAPLTSKKIEFFDETLRDGLQSPSVTDPPLDEKIELLHLMERLGITAADLGLPCAGKRAYEDVTELCREIARGKLKIQAACAGRTVVKDIEPALEIQQATGVPLQMYAFIGSSPIRLFAEDWTVDTLLRNSEAAIKFAVEHGLELALVTEDTTRSRPEVLDRLFRHAISLGCRRLCLCDTVGWATPDGLRRLIAYTRDLIRGTGEDVKIDWHGHNDRGLGVTNSLYAIEFGADRVHGCALGIGERVGNAALDQILINLKLLKAIDNDLSGLLQYCRAAARAAHYDIPVNYPFAGHDAFRTATGVHAAAIIKAMRKGDAWLADRIYSGVPAGEFGRAQEIEIGPMSGLSNVQFWLEQHHVAYTDATAAEIFAAAKASRRVLTSEEVFEIVRRVQRAKKTADDAAREVA